MMTEGGLLLDVHGECSMSRRGCIMGFFSAHILSFYTRGQMPFQLLSDFPGNSVSVL